MSAFLNDCEESIIYIIIFVSNFLVLSDQVLQPVVDSNIVVNSHSIFLQMLLYSRIAKFILVNVELSSTFLISRGWEKEKI